MHDKKYTSIPKDLDPYTITFDRSVELIEAKRHADANKLIKGFPENPEITVLNGRFGPYIKAGKKNVKIPKGKEPKDLTLEECVILAENTPEKKGRWGSAKKAPEKVVAEKKPAAKKAKVAATKTAAKKIAPKKTAAKKTAAKKLIVVKKRKVK